MTSAQVNVVDGLIRIIGGDDDEIESIGRETTFAGEPWGEDETSLRRADNALVTMGWVRVGPWDESASEVATAIVGPLPIMVGRSEIAGRAGTSVGMIDAWRRRHADFPAPLVILAGGPVWAWPDVEAWLARPRLPGRPRKS